MLYIILCSILKSNITHVYHISIIGQIFQYEHMLQNIRYNIAMLLFADVTAAVIVSCSTATSSVRVQASDTVRRYTLVVSRVENPSLAPP
jgi:hypothetical protein